ncbi:hypothetical protein KC343_g1136 [Hortaea werneckii]|nr:hypothetical protein KC352_g7902 [Hortaea werneckii]KAI7571834.1 hypothetical protein KC317_g1297 [Hortaea werneckii]KAI7626764.1 hypothetical protein KC346_g1093 [Hortaea werneckii]KAI7636689.1 hypothetical protein KC343_g1136 [Hortaea werneckii]KAI7681578.1 hypothetical protein KC319_g1505 [Hortaea werneckii]
MDVNIGIAKEFQGSFAQWPHLKASCGPAIMVDNCLILFFYLEMKLLNEPVDEVLDILKFVEKDNEGPIPTTTSDHALAFRDRSKVLLIFWNLRRLLFFSVVYLFKFHL